MNKIQYILRLIQAYRSYRAKKIRLDYLPIRLWIEPTDHCNLRCVMCPNKDLPKKKKGYMDLSLFQKIIDEASSFAFDAHLLHRGESLLHPRFFEMAGYAYDKGVRTKLHTNGTLLDEKKAQLIIDSGLDQISFSFDGYDRETYESIRVNGDFEKTVRNIVRFLEIKKERRSKKPYATLELINFPDSRIKSDSQSRKDFLRHFKGLTLNKLIIKEYHNWAGETGKIQKRKQYSPCTFLWNALVIFWDGSVLPCSQDFFGYYILGNVKESSLADIWNNDKMVHLRKQHIEGSIDEFETCRECDRVWRDKFLGVPKEYLWKFLLRKMS
ncbi:radical SAM/SPASM domain-containing protein [Acidobacteriota bacterium]